MFIMATETTQRARGPVTICIMPFHLGLAGALRFVSAPMPACPQPEGANKHNCIPSPRVQLPPMPRETYFLIGDPPEDDPSSTAPAIGLRLRYGAKCRRRADCNRDGSPILLSLARTSLLSQPLQQRMPPPSPQSATATKPRASERTPAPICFSEGRRIVKF
jgi:hypothetical protein